MSIQLASMLKELLGEDADKGRAKLKDLYGGLKNNTGALGSIIQGTSTLPGQEPNVGQSILGGAMTGFAGAGIFGAAAGAAGGFIEGSSNLDGYLLGVDEEQKSNILSKTVQPTHYKEGGEVQLVGIQTEKGELMLLPSTLELVKVAATELHKNMDKDKITDYVEQGAVVFSSSKDNKFDPSKLEDKVIGSSAAHYEENEIFPGEEFKIGNMFGNAKTFAGAVGKLKNKIEVVEDKKDIFDEVTNSENKMTRMLYLNELIKLQDEGNGGKSPQIYGLGGKVKHYGTGSSPGTPSALANLLQPTIGKKKKTNIEDDYFSNVESKMAEFSEMNKNIYKEGINDLSLLDSRMKGSLASSLGTNTLFNALQDHTTRPVIQDNTFISESFQNPSLSLIESQVGSLSGGVNSMAQLLASSGVNPKDIPAILSNEFESTLDAEAKMRTSFILDRNKNDQGKYGAYRDNLVSNRENVIGAQESTKTNLNQKYANFGEGLNKYFGDKRELDLGQFQAKRNIQQGYLDNEINMFKTNTGIEGKKLQTSDTMRRIQERLDRLDVARGGFQAENEMRGREIDALFKSKYHVPQTSPLFNNAGANLQELFPNLFSGPTKGLMGDYPEIDYTK